MDPVESELRIRRQCELLGVARSGLYYRPVEEGEENLARMRRLEEQYRRTPYEGVCGMTAWLRREGWGVNPKRVRRLLRQRGLEAIYPKPRLSQPGPGHRIYPSWLRGVTRERSKQVRSADLTSIRLVGSWLYLVAVMDWFRRYVLSGRLPEAG